MNVYELNTQPRNPTNNFTLKYCLFDTVKLTRNADKSEFTYSGQGIAFYGKGHWSFEKKLQQIIYIFWCNNASLSRIDNPKNNFLVVVERPTEGVSCIAGAT